jgi:hypothetical protein
MTWNFRIMKTDKGGWISYSIHEVYYDENKNVLGYTDALTGSNISVEELISDLERQLEDAKKCKDNILDFVPDQTHSSSMAEAKKGEAV